MARRLRILFMLDLGSKAMLNPYLEETLMQVLKNEVVEYSNFVKGTKCLLCPFRELSSLRYSLLEETFGTSLWKKYVYCFPSLSSTYCCKGNFWLLCGYNLPHWQYPLVLNYCTTLLYLSDNGIIDALLYRWSAYKELTFLYLSMF